MKADPQAGDGRRTGSARCRRGCRRRRPGPRQRRAGGTQSGCSIRAASRRPRRLVGRTDRRLPWRRARCAGRHRRVRRRRTGPRGRDRGPRSLALDWTTSGRHAEAGGADDREPRRLAGRSDLAAHPPARLRSGRTTRPPADPGLADAAHHAVPMSAAGVQTVAGADVALVQRLNEPDAAHNRLGTGLGASATSTARQRHARRLPRGHNPGTSGSPRP